MLNQMIIVGRLVVDPKVEELENGKKVSEIMLSVSRSYKNEEGEYETDLIPITLWGEMATSVVEYCSKGDLIGIKGRMETKDNKLIITAEKVTFLSSIKPNT